MNPDPARALPAAIALSLSTWLAAPLIASKAVAAPRPANHAEQDGGSSTYFANFAALQSALRSLDQQHASCRLTSLAKTWQGRDVWLLTLSADPETAASRPALLVVAGLDARHAVGVETALRVARSILADHADLLQDTTIYIVPCANPDGFELRGGKVNLGHIGNVRPVDDDRDGAADENGPSDLNGDGVITMMRRIDPPLDDRATHMADPAEPRLLKRADASKGERPIYSLYVEGIDADNDGLIGEDGIGGVDLDRNFLHRYPEHAADAGPMPLSEPETLALADFVIASKNIIAAITYGRHDNLINVPDGRGTDISGRGPRDLDAGDVELYREVSKKYKELTGQQRAAGSDTAGSFQAWVYAQRGVPSFASTVWGRPDLKEEPRGGGASQNGNAANDAAKPDAVSGEWTGSVTLQDVGEMPFAITLALKADNSVSGTLNAAGQTGGKLVGTFDPAASTANLTADFGDGESGRITAKFQGDTMTGTYETGAGGMNIAFTAKRPTAAVPASSRASETGARASSSQAAASPTTAAAPRRGGGGGNDASKPEDAEGAAWLQYSDTMRDRSGFIEWTPFDHPTLGKVEIGGFVPGFQMNPPAADLDDIGSKQTAFAVDVINRRPRISVQGPEIVKLADGLYEVRFGIANDGSLPTATAMARKARSIFPTVVRISTPVEDIVAGNRINRTWGIGGSGDRAAYFWIVRAKPGSEIAVDVVNPHFGDQKHSATAE